MLSGRGETRGTQSQIGNRCFNLASLAEAGRSADNQSRLILLKTPCECGREEVGGVGEEGVEEEEG